MHLLILVFVGLFSTYTFYPGQAATGLKTHDQPYAGQHRRDIKSLSKQDIDDLQNGRGWGLAKAAELNGVPGPLHALELRSEIGLSDDQTARVQHLYDDMKKQSIPLGNQLVALERQLNEGFAEGQMTDGKLKQNLAEISNVSAALRFVHLSMHLKTVKIMSQAQIENYNQLRGYSAAGPDDSHSMHHKTQH